MRSRVTTKVRRPTLLHRRATPHHNIDFDSDEQRLACGLVSHPLLKRLGARVRELRKAKGLFAGGIADICKIDRIYMSEIERVRNTAVLILAKLARALGLSLSDLFPV